MVAAPLPLDANIIAGRRFKSADPLPGSPCFTGHLLDRRNLTRIDSEEQLIVLSATENLIGSGARVRIQQAIQVDGGAELTRFADPTEVDLQSIADVDCAGIAGQSLLKCHGKVLTRFWGAPWITLGYVRPRQQQIQRSGGCSRGPAHPDPVAREGRIPSPFPTFLNMPDHRRVDRE